MCEEQPAVFFFILREIQLVLLNNGSVLIHDIVYAAGDAVFFNCGGHTADDQIKIEQLHDFVMDHIVNGRL